MVSTECEEYLDNVYRIEDGMLASNDGVCEDWDEVSVVRLRIVTIVQQ
jgi:hypothetical protein